MKALITGIFLFLSLSVSTVRADSNVFAYSVDRPVADLYDKLYKSLEDARLYGRESFLLARAKSSTFGLSGKIAQFLRTLESSI